MKIEIRNELYSGANGRQHTYDLLLPDHYNGNTIIFMHGFMGFKDWGCWGLMMDYFVSKGFGFCRFNITHNGTTPDHPIDFVDLKAFGHDSYYRELSDVKNMINLVEQKIPVESKLCLMGHSRGGGMVFIAGVDERISIVISLAGISRIASRFPDGEVLENWREAGVRYVHNGRTNQDLPQYYVLYDEFKKHEDELDIKAACLKLKKPVLLFHGDADLSVSIDEGMELAEWLKTKLITIHGTEHTFGSSHPWTKHSMPDALKEVCEISEKFILNNTL